MENQNPTEEALRAELDALNAEIHKIEFTPSGRVRMNLTAAQADRLEELRPRALKVANEINRIVFERRRRTAAQREEGKEPMKFAYTAEHIHITADDEDVCIISDDSSTSIRFSPGLLSEVTEALNSARRLYLESFN